MFETSPRAHESRYQKQDIYQREESKVRHWQTYVIQTEPSGLERTTSQW